MLSVTHATTAAFITTKIPYPVISIPLALGSHYLEDYIKHWDVGQGISNGHKTKRNAFYQELFLDFPLSIIIVYLFFQHGQPFSVWPWVGWFVGLLPDFIEFPRNFLHYEPAFLKPFNDFHHRFHNSIPDKVAGLIPQILIIIAIYFLK